MLFLGLDQVCEIIDLMCVSVRLQSNVRDSHKMHET